MRVPRIVPRRVNPVLRRELLERWRSRRAPMTLTIYLAVLGAGLYLLYRIGLSALGAQMGFMGQGGGDASLLGPMLGRFLLESLLFFVLALVLFVAPGYAAAQISGERERQTLSLLQVTLLSPLQIVLGKLGAAMAWLTLLVVATVPLGAAAFFLGGVGLGELLRGVVYILVIAVSVAAMAIGISASTKRTTGSIVLTYGLVLALTGGTFFVSIAEYVFRASRMSSDQIVPVALYLNPAYGLADAVVGPSAGFGFGLMGGVPSPLTLIAQALPRSGDVMIDRGFERGFEGGVMVEDMVVLEGGADFDEGFAEPMPEVFPAEPDFGPMPEPMPPPFPEPFPEQIEQRPRQPVWLQVMGLYAALGVVGLVVAHRRLRGRRPGSRRGRGTAADPVTERAPTPAPTADPPPDEHRDRP